VHTRRARNVAEAVADCKRAEGHTDTHRRAITDQPKSVMAQSTNDS
jgi:hypothetical protein